MKNYEEYGIFHEVRDKTGDEEFARWCTDRYPWGAFDIGHERKVYDAYRTFQPGVRARLRHDWEDVPSGTPCTILPGGLRDWPGPMMLVALDDGRQVEVPLFHLAKDEGGPPPAA